MKKIFESKGKLNTILEGENYHYLMVTSKRGKNAGNTFVCAFDGGIKRERNGVWYTVADLLAKHIEDHSQFWFANGGTPRSGRPSRRIEEVLNAIYTDTSLKSEEDFTVSIASRSGILFSSYDWMPEDEANLFYNNKVIDLTQRNIRTCIDGSIAHEKGMILHGVIFDEHGKSFDIKGIAVVCRGEWFFTYYTEALLNILRKISFWEISKGGALKTMIKGKNIAFSTIIYGYVHNMIHDGPNVKSDILATHNLLMKQKCEIDHMTENKHINLPWLLVKVKKGTNRSFGVRRTSIKSPCFFYNVCDHKMNQVLVRCGVDEGDRHYERNFFFDLTSDTWEEDYKACFTTFHDKVKSAGYLTKNPNESLLCYWADPWRVGSKGDPHIELLRRPLEGFKKYGDGALDDMPIF